MENLDVEVLAGIPFMEVNDIAVRPAKRRITFVDNTFLLNGSPVDCPAQQAACPTVVLRAPATSTTGLATTLSLNFYEGHLQINFTHWSHVSTFLTCG